MDPREEEKDDDDAKRYLSSEDREKLDNLRKCRRDIEKYKMFFIGETNKCTTHEDPKQRALAEVHRRKVGLKILEESNILKEIEELHLKAKVKQVINRHRTNVTNEEEMNKRKNHKRLIRKSDLKKKKKTGKKNVIGSGREAIGQHKDGSTFPIELSISENKIGDTNNFTGIVRDISKQKTTIMFHESCFKTYLLKFISHNFL